ncbi:MAG: hypothetical protein IJT31_02075 [Oscillibacter sp.]|nr:hypothetical protein [Oscillibacter sp.]
MSGKREYGDYQTPPDFVEKVCLYLKDFRDVRPAAVVEPTCGLGNFLRGGLMFDAEAYYGVELNPDYCAACRNSIRDRRVHVIRADAFSFPFRELTRNLSPVLVIGNPPWATNSALSALQSGNLPPKRNFKGLKGLDARTGAANFDICEAIILRLVDEYRDSRTLIAMLCKTSVARNVFQELKRTQTRFESCDLLEFDARKVFGVHASACVLLLQLTDRALSPDVCRVYDFENPGEIKSRFRVSGGRCEYARAARDSFDGRCCFEWRQGVKHDCAKVMELTISDGVTRNGDKEPVDIEPNLLFPLVKSSMFKSPVVNRFSKFVIVTQRKPREDTGHIALEAPETWAYLNRYREAFEKRKSSIYRGAPPFSMFGIGDYSYARYKVGISGFYKEPLFSLLYSEDGKPVMTDDTSYFIPFPRYDLAYVCMLLLNSARVRDFLTGVAFPDMKRPYTKKVLSRLDFQKIVRGTSADELRRTERDLCLSPCVTDSMYGAFQRFLTSIERVKE